MWRRNSAASTRRLDREAGSEHHSARDSGARIVDADSHLVEDFDKLHALTDARYHSCAPHLAPHGPSGMVRIGGVYQAQAPGMTRGDANSRRGLDGDERQMRKWSEAGEVGFDPVAKLALMDEIGVDGSIIFPLASSH